MRDAGASYLKLRVVGRGRDTKYTKLPTGRTVFGIAYGSYELPINRVHLGGGFNERDFRLPLYHLEHHPNADFQVLLAEGHRTAHAVHQ